MFKTFFLWRVKQKRKFKAWFVRIWQLLWFRVRLRGDEFHPSLGIDADRRSLMTTIERDSYDLELTRRRDLAHELDLQNENRAREKRPANTKT